MSDLFNQRQTGMSAAHTNPSTRNDNPLLKKTQPVSPAFDAALRPQSKKTRRENFMVKRQAPQLAPRPGKSIAADADRAKFNKEWESERNDALREAKQARREMYVVKRGLDASEARADQIPRTGNGDERRQLHAVKRGVTGITEESNRSFGKFKQRVSPYLR